MHCLYIIQARELNVGTHVKITQQWKSALTEAIKEKKKRFKDQMAEVWETCRIFCDWARGLVGVVSNCTVQLLWGANFDSVFQFCATS